MTAKAQIWKLLDQLKAGFPRKKLVIEKMMKEYGLDESVELKIESPEEVTVIPTFDSKQTKIPSPMLQARFDYASTIVYAGEAWLAGNEMQSRMKKRTVRS